MSVVGIDLGNNRSKVAIARRRGIDIAVNNVSNRETPSLVSFNGDERFMGESAMTQVVSNAKNTVGNILKLLGQKFDSAAVREVADATPLTLVPGPDGGVLVEVTYEGKQQTFTPEHLLAMLLSDLRKTAEGELKSSVVDCVISVPTHFRVGERQAVIDAAKIIGLNPLTLINSTTAAALQWGFYRVPEEGQIVCICDCGESSFDVAIAQFSKDKLKILGTASSTAAAGVSLDTALAKHLASVFQTKYKIDPLSRPRPKVRLLQAAEKAKRILSGINQTPVNIECLMDDIDVSALVTREEFEEMCKPHIEQISVCVAQALAVAGVTADKVSAAELIGGCSWIPMIANGVSAAFNGLAVSRTLNASESAAKGACLQCAMLSVTLKVRDYVIEDLCAYSVDATWPVAGAEHKTVTVFEHKGKLPDRKLLTFMRDEPFEITLKYKDTGDVISRVRVSGMKDTATRQKELDALVKTKAQQGTPADSAPPTAEPNKIKVAFELTKSGIVLTESANVHEDYEIQVPAPKEDTTAPPAAASPAPQGDTPMADADASETPRDTVPVPEVDMKDAPAAAAPAAAAAEQNAMVWKKKTRKTAIPCDKVLGVGLTATQLNEVSSLEVRLVSRDREIKERLDAKNSLESYVYDMREKLAEAHSKYSKFVADQDRKAYLGLLQTCEDWLYSEAGEEASRAVFSEKLSELKRMGDIIEGLYRESDARPDVVNEVKAAIEVNRLLAQSTEDKYSHIAAEDRDKALAKCAEVEATLAARVQQIEAQPKTDKPAFTCAQIKAMSGELESFVKVIMNKPKPAPKKDEPKPQDTPQPAQADAQPTQDQEQPPQQDQQQQPQEPSS